MKIKIALDHTSQELHSPIFIRWDVEKFPHLLLTGASGSGKTYLLRIILASISAKIPNARMIVCDFKGDSDFEFLEGCSDFYRYFDVQNGLEAFSNLLRERQSGANKTIPYFLVFDEYVAFLNALEKKKADAAKQTLSLLLMMGRSFNLHVIVSVQRADAAYFATARDNFSAVIAMGKLSKEAVDMLFYEYKEEIRRDKSRGEGYCLMGSDLRELVVPRVCNPARLESLIRDCLIGRDRGGPEARAAGSVQCRVRPTRGF